MSNDIQETLHESADFKLPKQLITDLKNAGFLRGDAFDNVVLEAIEFIWCKRPYLHMQLSRFPLRERYTMIRAAELNRLERWLYSRIMNQRYVSTKTLIAELREHLGVVPSKRVYATIRKMRRLVHDDRFRYGFSKKRSNP
jgi:hypothetical protein